MPIPYVIESNGHAERTYDIYSRLLKDRIVMLSGEIEDHMANAIVAQLLFLQSDDSKKSIKMYINSPGGVVTAGLAIYDVMQLISCPVHTFCFGQAASMAAVLLAGGEKGKRYGLANTRIMIHQPSGGNQGQASDIAIAAQEIMRIKQTLIEILAKHTKKSVKALDKDCDRDYFMNVQQAIEYGIIDEVI